MVGLSFFRDDVKITKRESEGEGSGASGDDDPGQPGSPLDPQFGET